MENPLLYIIDDDLISIFDIKIRLYQSSYPHRTQCFESTEVAFKMLEDDFKHGEGIPDIILISFDLEGMDGIVFLDKLKRHTYISKKTQVYIFSVYGISAHLGHIEDDELVQGCFTKPLENKDVDKIFKNYSNRNNGPRLYSLL